MERRVTPAVLGEEVEELPLRHEGDEAAVGRQVREVGDRHGLAGDVAGQTPGLLVRPLEEFVEKAEFGEEFEGRGVDGVAAEVAEEVAVLFEDDHFDAGAGEEEAGHHAGRPAAGHDAADGQSLGDVR